MQDRERGCGIFGLIVIGLAIFGGYTLYNRWQDGSADSGCKGWNSWGMDAQARWNELQSATLSLDPQGATKAQANEMSQKYFDARDEQSKTTPPEKAKPFHEALLSFYGGMGDGWSDLAEGRITRLDTPELRALAQVVADEQAAANTACIEHAS